MTDSQFSGSNRSDKDSPAAPDRKSFDHDEENPQAGRAGPDTDLRPLNPGLCTENPVGDFAVVKSANPPTGTAVTPGSAITYTLSFTNTGATSATVDHTDHLAPVLDDADPTAAPAIVGATNGLTVSAVVDGEFRILGELAGGTSVTVQYLVTVKKTARGDSVLRNVLVPGDEEPPGACIPGTQNCTEHPVTEVVVTKTADPASGTVVVAGQTVTYTLTFTNMPPVSSGTPCCCCSPVGPGSGSPDVALTKSPGAPVTDCADR